MHGFEPNLNPENFEVLAGQWNHSGSHELASELVGDTLCGVDDAKP